LVVGRGLRQLAHQWEYPVGEAVAVGEAGAGLL
jgi:hypothetical protein